MEISSHHCYFDFEICDFEQVRWRDVEQSCKFLDRIFFSLERIIVNQNFAWITIRVLHFLYFTLCRISTPLSSLFRTSTLVTCTVRQHATVNRDLNVPIGSKFYSIKMDLIFISEQYLMDNWHLYLGGHTSRSLLALHIQMFIEDFRFTDNHVVGVFNIGRQCICYQVAVMTLFHIF